LRITDGQRRRLAGAWENLFTTKTTFLTSPSFSRLSKGGGNNCQKQQHFLVEKDWITLSMNHRMAAALLVFTASSARDKTDSFLQRAIKMCL
jgi:hypothetical protein